MASPQRSLLDTSVVIGGGLESIPGEVSISVITLAELQFGVLVARDEVTRADRLRRLGVLQRHFSPLPVDDAVAASYSRLAAKVVAVGRQPRVRTMDLLIAATAHAHKARLCTRNPRDFNGLEDLIEIVSI